MKKTICILLSICTIGLFTACGSSDAGQNNRAPADKSPGGSTAVVYFSATGNTEKVADSLADALGTVAYGIVPAEKYTDEDLNYSNDSCKANREQQDDAARPGISNDLSEAAAADAIYLGYPIWWGTSPKIIQTFLDKYDLSGKTVYLFCTSGGSGIEDSMSFLQEMYPDVKIAEGKRFEANASGDDIAAWAQGLNRK